MEGPRRWRVYHKGNLYQIGHPVKFLWFKRIRFYKYLHYGKYEIWWTKEKPVACLKAKELNEVEVRRYLHDKDFWKESACP